MFRHQATAGMPGTHKSRIQRDYHHSFFFGRFDQPLHRIQLGLEKILFVQGQVSPIGRFLDVGLQGKIALVLDFDQIHARVPEIFQMFINRGLTKVTTGVKMDKESGRDVGLFLAVIQ
jgi:hypothetical protein